MNIENPSIEAEPKNQVETADNLKLAVLQASENLKRLESNKKSSSGEVEIAYQELRALEKTLMEQYAMEQAPEEVPEADTDLLGKYLKGKLGTEKTFKSARLESGEKVGQLINELNQLEKSKAKDETLEGKLNELRQAEAVSGDYDLIFQTKILTQELKTLEANKNSSEQVVEQKYQQLRAAEKRIEEAYKLRHPQPETEVVLETPPAINVEAPAPVIETVSQAIEEPEIIPQESAPKKRFRDFFKWGKKDKSV